MIRTLLGFIGGVAVGAYCLHGSASVDVQTTHNSAGEKIVVITADKERNAVIAAGRECKNGYSVIGEGSEDNKVILTVGCPEDKGLF